MSSADAVAREAAWLAAYSPADGLPGLLAAYGGPFDVVQPYKARTPAKRRRSLFVRRSSIVVERFGFNRKINHYGFELQIVWPQTSSTGQAESVQQALDDAVELVIQRINGPVNTMPLDKTHGARFMSVAENPTTITVLFEDPEQSLQQQADLKCLITYQADDQDYTA
ncbi:MAG: hypothetical protein HOY76_14405 [Streptomyces sp.]|nr:hypothetical protein [Streptomyces sp.]